MRVHLFVLLVMFNLGFVFAGIEDIDFDKRIVKVVSPDQSYNEVLQFFNNGERTILNIEKQAVIDFFNVPEAVEVERNSFGKLNIEFNKNLKSGVYVGKIIVSDSKGDFEEVIIILEKQDKGFEFDSASADGPEILSVVNEDFDLEVSIFNVNSKLTTAIYKFKILNDVGLELESKSKIVEVNREITFNERIKSSELEIGETYVAVFEVIGAGKVGTSTRIFTVNDETSLSPIVREEGYSRYILFIVIGFLLLFVFVLNHYWNRMVMFEARNWRKKLGEVRDAKFGNSARSLRKLSHQKSVLERAHKSGFVSRSSYEEGIREINSLADKVKKKV